ncbi:TolB family protein [Micromonospora sp. NPDC049048]|uniref:TolB family protein n=1 Tax=Micromonospora sp. NPDC049048 TaxID=3364263 RepID=UPI00371DC91D
MPKRRASAVATVIAAAAIVIVAGQAPGWLAARADAAPAEAVPSRVRDPWLWQATVGQHPVGPASVLFFTAHTRYFESTGVVVGRAGGYRLLPISVGEQHGLLSSDGRWYLRPGTGSLVDLRTGDERPAHRPGLRPLAWSPHGGQVLFTRDNDDTVIAYGPDNQQLDDPSKPDDLLIVDPWSGAERVIPVGTFASHSRAAWSPDGSLLAVTGRADPTAEASERQRLAVIDPVGGGVRWQVELGEQRQLAGRGAWSPDGRRIALLTYDGCARCADTAELLRRSWRIEYLDAATGRPVDGVTPVRGSAVELVAWRNGEPVVERQSQEADHAKRHTVLAAVSAHGGEQVLLTAPGGVSDVEVPGDLLARAAYGGPEPRPSPFAAPPWWYAALAVPPLLVVLALARRRHPLGARAGCDHGGSADPPDARPR